MSMGRARNWLWWSRVGAAVYWLVLLALTHWPELSAEPLVGPDRGVVQANKIFHFTAFAGLTALLIAARPLGRRRGAIGNALAACVVGLVWAGLSEWTQQYVGRNTSLADAVANGMGVLSIYIVYVAGHVGRARPWAKPIVYTLRAVLLVVAPTLVVMATLPEGQPLVRDMAGLFVQDYRAGMDFHLHLLMAALISALLALASIAGRHRPRASAAATILIMLAMGPAIELVQWETGRGYSVRDVWAHNLGLLVTLSVWALALSVVAQVRRVGAGGESHR